MKIYRAEHLATNGLRRRFLTAKEAWMLPCLLCLLALAGCSGSEGVEPTPKTGEESVITFMGNLADDKEETRAATPLKDLKQQFQVWAYKNDAIKNASPPVNYTSYQAVMPSYTVNYGANTAYTTTSNTHDWEYVGQQTTGNPEQTIKYWDMDAKAYRFFAYALGTATAPATPNTVFTNCPSVGGTTHVSATLSATVDAGTDKGVAAAPYFSRLWFSDGNPTNYPNRLFGQPVNLEFLKPFTRVRFMFIFSEGLSFGREAIEEPVFKPTNSSDKIVTGGTVQVSYPLTGTETTESWTITPADPAISSIDEFNIDYYEDNPLYPAAGTNPTTYPNSVNHWYTVFPADTQGSYTVSVKIFDRTRTAIVPAEFMSWELGYEYTYKFKITESGITLDVIQVGINNWISIGENTDRSVYNW